MKAAIFDRPKRRYGHFIMNMKLNVIIGLIILALPAVSYIGNDTDGVISKGLFPRWAKA